MCGFTRFRVLMALTIASFMVLTSLFSHRIHDGGLLPLDEVRTQLSDNSTNHSANESQITQGEISAQNRPRVAVVSMLYGENDLYERAINTHLRYAERHGYPAYILRKELLSGVWNKVAYLMHVMMAEIDKGELGAQWVMWVDADSAVVNPAIPLEIFLPPDDYPDIHVLGSKDQNGFNAGMFLIRVHKWSINLMANTMALEHNNEEVAKGFAEQTALYILFNQTENRPHILFQPRKWFNTYEFHYAYEGKPGNLFVHFVGLESDRWAHMRTWLEILEGPKQEEWEIPLVETDYDDRIHEYWTTLRHGRDAVRQVKERVADVNSLTGNVKESLDHLETVLWTETDQLDTVRNATEWIREAVHNEPDFATAGPGNEGSETTNELNGGLT